MMRQILSKKIQIPQNSQKLFVAKCFVEQQLEQIQKNTRISIKGNPDDGSVFFRVVKTKEIAAFAKDGKLYVFAKPLPEFKGLPLDTTMVPLSNIVKTDGVMKCTKCKSWMKHADITKCPCGGYLQKRKRFHVRGEITESLDAEYLEIQSALKDIKISAKMDCKPRQKSYVTTGITPSMAGISSVIPDTKPRMVTCVSEQGVTWLEKWGKPQLIDNVIIQKIDGFKIPPNDSDVQASLRAHLRKMAN